MNWQFADYIQQSARAIPQGVARVCEAACCWCCAYLEALDHPAVQPAWEWVRDRRLSNGHWRAGDV